MNKLGFGFLRLPQISAGQEQEIDWPLLFEMVDTFLARGGTYFDTAYTYLDGASEAALRRAVVERYPREAFQIADKLPSWHIKAPEDCQRYFEEQCERCGVGWFDVYLLHWLNAENYAIAQKHDEFAFLRQLKAQGKARKIGFSDHGDAALLEKILAEHPETEIVQLQINYLDWENPAMQARECYEAAARQGKEVVVMEPVKGGTLANLPKEAEALLKAYHPGASCASWAMRFAQMPERVSIVLSGMNAMEQMLDNLADFSPLAPQECAVLEQVCQLLNQSIAIPCTACRYCTAHCPKNIAIPDYFGIYNEYSRRPDEGWKMAPAYASLAAAHGKASDCVGCRACERNCPQKIKITEWLAKIAQALER